MKYAKVDWARFQTIPSQEVFDDWVAMRKEKKTTTSQTALNRAAKYVNLLYGYGYTADDSLSAACEYGWKGMDWVFKEEQKKGFPDGSMRTRLSENVRPIRSTRDIALTEMLTDRSWAYDNE